ncbi:MAG: hypothetical protein ACRDQ2_08705 [Gaiellales bacterium]
MPDYPDRLLDAASYAAVPPKGQTKKQYIRQLLVLAGPVAGLHAKYQGAGMWYRMLVGNLALIVAIVVGAVARSTSVEGFLVRSALIVLVALLVPRVTSLLFVNRIWDWENRRFPAQHTWRSNVAQLVVTTGIGVGALLLTDAGSPRDVILFPLAVGSLAAGVRDFIGMLVGLINQGAAWPPGVHDARPFAIFYLLHYWHHLANHGGPIDEAARLTVSVGVWLARSIKASVSRQDPAVLKETTQLADRVQGAFAGEAVQLLKGGVGQIPNTCRFYDRAFALILTSQWERLAAGADLVLPPSPSRLRPILREVARGLLPPLVAAVFVALGVPPRWLFGGLLVVMILYGVVTLLRLADPNFRAKLADIRAVQDLLKPR